MSSPNGSPTYRVVTSCVLKQRIKTLHLEAAQSGHGQAFLDALRVIYDRLGTAARANLAIRCFACRSCG